MIKKSLNNILRSVQLDVVSMARSLIRLPRYFSEKRYYASRSDMGNWPIEYHPILLDGDVESASLGEYFWQDLFVAKNIINSNPERHIDVGSRIDGFVAHLACVRLVEVFDIRPMSSIIENVNFVQWDITDSTSKYHEISDCVSCLHTLEHIGLGRYGDQLDPDGWEKGFTQLTKLLKKGGILWLSVPIGRQRVEFNAHRVFNPKTVMEYGIKLGLSLTKLYYYKSEKISASVSIEIDIEEFSKEDYMLGIFHFEKIEL